jgi:hypothetical protein
MRHSNLAAFFFLEILTIVERFPGVGSTLRDLYCFHLRSRIEIDTYTR